MTMRPPQALNDMTREEEDELSEDNPCAWRNPVQDVRIWRDGDTAIESVMIP
jgi:hypothetical protein